MRSKNIKEAISEFETAPHPKIFLTSNFLEISLIFEIHRNIPSVMAIAHPINTVTKIPPTFFMPNLSAPPPLSSEL